MDRRTFLKGAIAVPTVAQLTGIASPARGQQKEFTPRPGTWRTFEITTRIEVLEPTGTVRAWLPMPSVKSEYQKLLGDQWSGNAKVMKPLTDGIYGAGILYAEFASGETAPVVELTSRFQTQDRALDWSKKTPAQEDPAVLRMWTKATELMPTDGIVRETAFEITRGKTSDVERVRAVYDWILANTYREPKGRGAGARGIQPTLQ